MPSHMPSSFASAAAGQASSRDSRGSTRGESRGSGDWPRRENRGPNGTLTLRRSSTTPYNTSVQQSAQGDALASISNSDSTFGQSQQYASQGTEPITEARFSKSRLLDIYQMQQSSDDLAGNVSNLFVNNWDPGHPNSTNGRGWGKGNDTRDQTYGPEVCWDQSGQVQPIGLEEMSEMEKAIFSGDVNSPLKPPPQNTNKDQNTPGSANGRKLSVSHGQGGSSSYGLASPTSTRPGTRRRETSDSLSYSSLASPGGTGRFNRDELSPMFNRKAPETKDSLYGTSESDDRPGDMSATSGNLKMTLPFGGLIRSNTAGSALGNGPASPWGNTPASAGLSPMGNFGSFAMPGSSLQQTASNEKRSGFGSLRGESRLALLMPQNSTEDLTSKATDMNKGPESSRPWRSRPRTDTDTFGEDSLVPGSTIMEGGHDTAGILNQQRRAPGFDTPTRQGDFGMSDMPGFRESMQRRDEPQQTPQGHYGTGHGHLSPTDTNPYGSPEAADTEDNNHGGADSDSIHHIRSQALGGPPENIPNHYGTLPRGLSSAAFDGSDRSQNSSAGASKPFSSLGGLSGLGALGALGGWPTNPNQVGTPDRERTGFQGAFGNSLFGPLGDMQQPSLGNIGGPFGGASSANLSGSTSIGRGSKLGSLFPAAMQAQMQTADNEGSVDSDRHSGFGAIGRNAFGGPRETDSPMRSGRGVFDDLLQTAESRSQGTVSSAEVSQSQTSSAPRTAPLYPQGHAPGTGYQQPHASADATSNTLPQAQQRTMVMPDRMRWVYLDPQGQIQGPWSGLEMHEWYKASFFTADLSVKKLEDDEFEPLGQLIRRIGNSREPFLVPQIGIPHGPPTTQAGPPFAAATATSGSGLSQSGVVQPPFAGAFPSFGTTLTAEQQNNLERRKQEEQYLMARQREFLAQQQVNMKMQMQGGIPAALHHHSSAHSLQSQPSFGSITSPIGIPNQGPLPAASGVGGFFESGPRQAPGPGIGLSQEFLREDELARLSLQDRQHPGYGGGLGAPQPPPAQQFTSMHVQQPGHPRDARPEPSEQDDPQGFKARLREFEQLRAQHELEQNLLQSTGSSSEPVGQMHNLQTNFRDSAGISSDEKPLGADMGVLSLTEQVQKAASAKQSPAGQPELSPWAKISPNIPMPFPPPQSATPLPAPTALRGRSNLPETLNAGSRSRSETPEIATPSIAPWAKEPADAPKGPSLREIQEAEAKKAAKLEEAATAVRRALLEQELRNQPTAPAPGLPTSATWGSSSSPGPAANVPSAWAKPTAKSQTPSSSSAANKKTLADIQKEEELRKQKLAAANTAAAIPGQSSISAGKRYADLAGKPSSSPTPGAAWSTVGAGGKVKAPSSSAAATPSASRATTTTTLPTAATLKTSRPAALTARSTTGGASAGQSGVTAAHQEFNKWAKNALSKGLNSDINVDEFVRMLADFPAEAGVIADAVYANSQLMDGRRFAEEFLRRKKLADKGVVENAPSAGFSTASESKSSGGWSEVAKKNPPKEEPTAGFKVVPNKKKGRK